MELPVLKDSYNRTHTYLRLSVTDRCNFRCRYCMPPEGMEAADRSQILRPEEMGRIVQMLADWGLRKVRLTGGEPLVRRGLEAILDQLASVNPRPKLALTTNGLLLTRWLDRLVAAGVHRINVSLDSLDPERFAAITGFDGWSRVWDGIQAALNHPGIEKVKINVVLQQGINDDEIVAFAQLTRAYLLDVRFIELMPVEAATWRSAEWMSGDEVLAKFPDFEEVAASSGDAGPARLFRLPDALGRIGIIAGESCPACAGCNRLRLTAKGMLLRCLFDPAGLDLRAAIRSGQSEDAISDDIHRFLIGKRDLGKPAWLRSEDDRFSPSLVQVGG